MSRVPDAMRGVSKRFLKPLVRRFAGGRVIALLRHTGRTSGRSYETPLLVRRAGDRLYIALTYGPKTDWFRNIAAIGVCELQLRGRWYRAVAPRIVGPEIALVSFSPLQRLGLRLARIDQFVQLCLASSHAPCPLTTQGGDSQDVDEAGDAHRAAN